VSQADVHARTTVAQEAGELGAAVRHVKHLHRRSQRAGGEQQHHEGQRVGKLQCDHIIAADAAGPQGVGHPQHRAVQVCIGGCAIGVGKGGGGRIQFRPASYRFEQSVHRPSGS
jgi:hypothetical protein